MVDEIFRWPVARTMAQQFAHTVQAFINQDTNAMVVTIDGVGACDLIPRGALLMGDEDQILSFARCFLVRVPRVGEHSGSRREAGRPPHANACSHRASTRLCRPDRVRTMVTIIDEELIRHEHISIHAGAEPWRSHHTSRCRTRSPDWPEW